MQGQFPYRDVPVRDYYQIVSPTGANGVPVNIAARIQHQIAEAKLLYRKHPQPKASPVVSQRAPSGHEAPTNVTRLGIPAVEPAALAASLAAGSGATKGLSPR